MSDVPITVLVVDDERLARQRVRGLLRKEADIEIAGEFANGLEALAAITELRPDLIFLDVQMPDLDGPGVVTALGAEDIPEIVFVTAHSSYMERAFEMHAIDYLRKPYQDARFASALAHARRRIHALRAESAARADAPIGEDAPGRRFAPMVAALNAESADPRIALQDGRSGTWLIVNRDEIEWINADGSAGVLVHIGKQSYLWRKTLSELQQNLDPRVFLRIHRSYIVNAERIRQVKPLLKGEFAIVLSDGTILDTGRTYRAVIEAFLRERELQPVSGGA